MLKNMNTWSKNLLYIMVIFAVPKLAIRHNFAELLFYLAIALVAVIMSLAPNWGGAVISAVLFGVLTEVFDWVSYAYNFDISGNRWRSCDGAGVASAAGN